MILDGTARARAGCALLALGFVIFACGDDESSNSGSGGADQGGTGGKGGAGSKASGGSAGKGGSAGSSSGGKGGSPGNGGGSGASASGGGSGASASGGSGGADPGSNGGEGGAAGETASGPNIVFVTSVAWQPQALGGLQGADEKCQSVATMAGRAGTFVAWLSDATTDARDRLGGARGWVRTDGKPFADRVEDIAAGLHFYTPNVDQNGNGVTAGISTVVTGTGADGRASAPVGDYCQNYTGPNASNGVVRGDLNYYDDRWTIFGETAGELVACASAARLYCFQIDHDDPVDASFPPSRKAFVTRSAVRPDMGRNAFDAQCATEAEAAALTGSFLALVSTNTQAAASRFDLTELTYARVDGVPIVEQAQDLAGGSGLVLPLNVYADGELATGPNLIAYSGGATPSATSTNATSCNNWSISAFESFVRVGDLRMTTAAWWNDRTDWRCNTWVKVYCLEE